MTGIYAIPSPGFVTPPLLPYPYSRPLCVHPSSSLVATASDDETAGVWSWHSGNPPNPLARLCFHTDPVLRVAWSPEGTHLATASADCRVAIWRPPTTPDPTAPWIHTTTLGTPHPEEVYAGLWSSDKHMLTISGPAPFLWDVSRGTCIAQGSATPLDPELAREIPPRWRAGSLFCACLSQSTYPDPFSIIAGASDGVLRWWDTEHNITLSPVAHSRVHAQGMSVAVDRLDANYVCSTATDGTVAVRDLRNFTTRCIDIDLGSSSRPRAATLVRSGPLMGWLLVAGGDGSVHALQPTTGDVVQLPLGSGREVVPLCVAWDGDVQGEVRIGCEHKSRRVGVPDAEVCAILTGGGMEERFRLVKWKKRKTTLINIMVHVVATIINMRGDPVLIRTTTMTTVMNPCGDRTGCDGGRSLPCAWGSM